MCNSTYTSVYYMHAHIYSKPRTQPFINGKNNKKWTYTLIVKKYQVN